MMTPFVRKQAYYLKQQDNILMIIFFETCLTLNQSNQINNAGPAVVVIRSADFYTNVQLIKWSKFEDM